MKNSINVSKEKLVSLAAIVAKKSVSESNAWGWPPNCVGIFYQAERPKKLCKHKNTKIKNQI